MDEGSSNKGGGYARKRHRTLARTIKHTEQVNPKRDHPRPRRLVRFWADEKRHPSDEQTNRHTRKRRQQELASAEGVDGVHRGEGEEEVDEAETPGTEEG